MQKYGENRIKSIKQLYFYVKYAYLHVLFCAIIWITRKVPFVCNDFNDLL